MVHLKGFILFNKLIRRNVNYQNKKEKWLGNSAIPLQKWFAQQEWLLTRES